MKPLLQLVEKGLNDNFRRQLGEDSQLSQRDKVEDSASEGFES